MKTAVEIYKLLPKTNCGTCGMTSCFGFAAKLAAHQASADACASLTTEARRTLKEAIGADQAAHKTSFEQTRDALKPKVAALNFERTAARFGADRKNADTLEITFLNTRYTVTRERVTDATGAEPAAWITILMYNHLCMPDPPLPANEWITFSSVPASHAKDKAWAGHVEAVIADRFSGKVAELRTACEKQGGTPAAFPGNHDAAYTFRFFPHYPALLLFNDAVPDEDFPAQCKLLLDRTAPYYLDIESMVVLGEEFAGRLIG